MFVRWTIWIIGFAGLLAGLGFLTERLWISWATKTGSMMSGTTPLTVFADVSVLCIILIWMLLIPRRKE